MRPERANRNSDGYTDVEAPSEFWERSWMNLQETETSNEKASISILEGGLIPQ